MTAAARRSGDSDADDAGDEEDASKESTGLWVGDESVGVGVGARAAGDGGTSGAGMMTGEEASDTGEVGRGWRD
jgi:hypothetical protein